jgi:hypothetical protein
LQCKTSEKPEYKQIGVSNGKSNLLLSKSIIAYHRKCLCINRRIDTDAAVSPASAALGCSALAASTTAGCSPTSGACVLVKQRLMFLAFGQLMTPGIMKITL